MKKSQNTTTLILMLISLLLLGASQWFWLKSEFKDQKRSFYSNTDLLFKETVRTLEDSLISRSIASAYFLREAEKNSASQKNKTENLKDRPRLQAVRNLEDSIMAKYFEKKNYRRSLNLKRTDIYLSSDSIYTDTTKKVVVIRGKKSNDSTDVTRDTSFHIATIHYQGIPKDADSLDNIRRLLTQLHKLSLQEEMATSDDTTRRPRRRFNFRSASVDSVYYMFNWKTQQMGYPVTFEITKDSIPIDTADKRMMRSWSEIHKRLRTAKDTIIVNGIPVLNPELISSNSVVPNIIYKATPIDLDKHIYKKLQPNIFFSLFLWLITAGTFFIIYRSLQKQARLNIIKNDLISNVTHELKTPLATLSVALEALQQFGASANPQTTKEYLEISRNEVSRLALMVDNILKTSLLEKNAVEAQPTQVDLEHMVRSISKSWQPRISQLNGNINLEANGTDFGIEADEVQISSIINNLIDNAVKYSKEQPQVDISLIDDHSTVILKVKDHGIGIPKEYQKQVFEKFFRVPTGDRHNVKGYGLGLNFVKHIMDLHQGSVTLDSDSNGTEFTLTFKRKL